VLAEEGSQRKRGILDVVLVLVAAALIMAPSYVSLILLHRLNLDISIVALIALAMFLVGVVLLVRVLRD
jgi:hypothetical protein